MKHIILTILVLMTNLSCTSKMEMPVSTTASILETKEVPCGLIHNNENEEIRWNSYPVNFVIDQTIPQEFHQAIKDAATEWNTRLGFEAIRIHNQDVAAPASISANYNVIYAVLNPNDLKPEQEAVTLSNWIGHYTQSTHIAINFARFQFSTDTVDPTKVDMISLMIHEFGHSLSLDHDDQHESVMHTVLQGGEIRQHISDLDKAAVLCGVARKDSPIKTSVVAVNQ